MGIVEAVKSAARRTFDYSGRSSRSEYWWFVLVFFLMFFGPTLILFLIRGGDAFEPQVEPVGAVNWIVGVISMLLQVAMMVMGLSLGVRRLHDSNKRGWWLLIFFAPLGLVIFIVLMCLNGTEGSNRFGYDPLGGGMDIFD